MKPTHSGDFQNPQAHSASNYMETPDEAVESPSIPNETKSYGEILTDIASSAKQIVISDAELFFSELNKVTSKLGNESKKFALFTILLALSSIPIMAFLIIGLGVLLDGQYWLSALIVGAVFSITGVVGIMMALKRLSKVNLKFPNTKRMVEREKRILESELRNLKSTIKGGLHGV